MDSVQDNPVIQRAQERSLTPESHAQPSPRTPELLAPAGDWEYVRAAVENGADAIYFGLDKFNARMRAQNFTEADLPALMEYLHLRGVKGYVTFNTLVFQNEMAEAEHYVRTLISSGVDAAVVQDVGICRMIRRFSPDFPIHASTQMTVTSARGVQFARELGCNLVVLARECSIGEIEKIQAAQPGAMGLPLEVFVHGALCVAYSGQCLTSEALGGRSANRGECAQACRMPYELISDEQLVPLGDRHYLLSPQDLASISVVPDLIRVDVASFKIEGRLKSPEYVANITRVYREAIDKIIGPGRGEPSGAPEKGRSEARRQYEMEMAFSRGLFTGWFRGTNNQALVHARFGKKRGVYLGRVTEVRRDGVVVQLEGPLKAGDGIVFDAGNPEHKEEGGRVYHVSPLRGSMSTLQGVGGRHARACTTGSAEHAKAWTPNIPTHEACTPNTTPSPNTGAVVLSFGRGDVDFNKVHVGDRIWKTSDPELERELRRTFEVETPGFQRPIAMEVHGSIGRPLTIIARDELGHVVKASSAMPLERAEKHALGADRLRDQLGRLGGTAYKLGELDNKTEGSVLLPLSELNRLRREVVRELDELRARPPRWTLNQEPVDDECGPEVVCGETSTEPELIVLVRNLAQLETVLSAGVRTVYCEFEDPKKYRQAVSVFREQKSPGEIWVAPPRIFKMGEEWTLKQVRSCEADGYLIRNYDHLEFFTGDRRIGDYSLNVANRLSAEWFLRRFGLERLTASYDLNFSQLEALLHAAPPHWFEITVHQHMPMFHMEHCVFCAFLSTGTDYTNCGRPCDRHELALRDRVGAKHPVKADVGCRNTVFNSLAQTGAEYMPRLLALGVRRFRLEFLNEAPGVVRQTIDKYRRLLAGEISGAHVWRDLKLMNQLGVTRGQIKG